MSATKAYRIQLASYQDIQLMLKWAAAEGWNPGLHDAFAFQLIDPYGFFIGYLEGQPISCISAVKYSSHYAFIGLYIVHPSFRGQGFGYQIWQHAMQYANECTIGLDGVIAQQQNYAKFGFKLAHRNIRYSLNETTSFRHFKHDHLILANQFPCAKLFEYDQLHFQYKRHAFLTAWLFMPNAKALIYHDHHQIKGYGVIRECSLGYKIGPLFADTNDIATIIFQGLCQMAKNTTQLIFLDIPEINQNATQLVESFSMKSNFEVARMYLGQAPHLPLQHIVGLTTFEVG